MGGHPYLPAPLSLPTLPAAWDWSFQNPRRLRGLGEGPCSPGAQNRAGQAALGLWRAGQRCWKRRLDWQAPPRLIHPGPWHRWQSLAPPEPWAEAGSGACNPGSRPACGRPPLMGLELQEGRRWARRGAGGAAVRGQTLRARRERSVLHLGGEGEGGPGTCRLNSLGPKEIKWKGDIL